MGHAVVDQRRSRSVEEPQRFPVVDWFVVLRADRDIPDRLLVTRTCAASRLAGLRSLDRESAPSNVGLVLDSNNHQIQERLAEADGWRSVSLALRTQEQVVTFHTAGEVTVTRRK